MGPTHVQQTHVTCVPLKDSHCAESVAVYSVSGVFILVVDPDTQSQTQRTSVNLKS